MKIKNLFTKDRRSELDKRIDEVSEAMKIVISELDKDGNTEVDQEIKKILEAIKDVDPVCDDHQKMVKSLDTLLKLKGNDVTQLETYKELAGVYKELNGIKNAEKSRNIISKDVIAKGIFILAGTLLTIYAEETKVITSKAWGRLPSDKF